MDKAASETIAAWSDIVSLLLLLIAIPLGGLNPESPVWGRSKRGVTKLAVALVLPLLWTVFRFIQEGYYRTPGPREFLAATVVYIARWLYLWYLMHREDSKVARMLRVARSLREVMMLRCGPSSKEQGHENQERREGRAYEVLLRRGVRDPPSKLASYWRGVKESERYHQADDAWELHLLQDRLHHEELDPLGTVEYLTADQSTLNSAYERFYKVVLRAVAHRSPTPEEEESAAESMLDDSSTTQVHALGAQPKSATVATNKASSSVQDTEATAEGASVISSVDTSLSGTSNTRSAVEVDFGPFFRKWTGIPVTRLAEESGARDPRPIGRVARRIAADAVHYITRGGGLRTGEQVELLNHCLWRTADDQFHGGLGKKSN